MDIEPVEMLSNMILLCTNSVDRKNVIHPRSSNEEGNSLTLDVLCNVLLLFMMDLLTSESKHPQCAHSPILTSADLDASKGAA